MMEKKWFRKSLEESESNGVVIGIGRALHYVDYLCIARGWPLLAFFY